jgi:ribosome-associated toxin RatA of RatAB toxin-antitoxin module
MTVIQRSALVRFPASLMFHLVDDIEAYPEFLPWCRSSRVLLRSEDIVEAELEIARGGFNQSFSTRNTRVAPKEIRMDLIEGPFRRLQGVWIFQTLQQDASKVSLELEFELSSKIASLAFGGMFSQICSGLIEAFHQRAKELYGRT